jgi:streptogramin lyase
MGWFFSTLKPLCPQLPHVRHAPKHSRSVGIEDLEGRQLLSQVVHSLSLRPIEAATSNLITGGDGNLWVGGSSPSGSSIDRIGLNGTVTAFPVPGAPSVDSLTLGPDGNVWFTAQSREADLSQSHGILGMVTPAGHMTEFPVAGNLGTFLAGIDLIASEPGSPVWFEFEGPDPGEVSEFGVVTAGAVRFIPFTNLPSPVTSIAAGPDGNLWFVYDTHEVGRVTPSGSITHDSVGALALSTIANGLNGTLLLTGQDGSRQNEVAQLSTAGAVTPYKLPAASSKALDSYLGAADESLWFASQTQLSRITSSGAARSYNLSSYLGRGGHSPFSIAAGRDGDLYFVDGERPVVYRIPPSKLPPPRSAAKP